MQPTDIKDPEYFHRVVDCQYACPAHTPVPEYIRLIAQGKYGEAYMINWDSNVFPGILGRTCDRPCEPACRRGRVEEEPVAICRLKRVAADFKDNVIGYMPQGPFLPTAKKIALIGAGPASLTVARDLAPLGYEIHLYDEQKAGGGFMRSQIPSFRLPAEVLDEEVGYILRLGIHQHFNQYVSSLKTLLDGGDGNDASANRTVASDNTNVVNDNANVVSDNTNAATDDNNDASANTNTATNDRNDAGGSRNVAAADRNVASLHYDAIFVGSGAPKGRDLPLPGREEGAANIHIGINWLANVAFEHTAKIGKRVIVLGGGNTAMDCCRTARRVGGEEVKVIVRSPFAEMKASPWEKEDAMHEDIPIIDNHVPVSFVIENGKLAGMTFQKVQAVYDEQGKRTLQPTGEPDAFYPADDVLVAVGQENAFPWIERDLGIDFDKWGMPVVDEVTFASTHPAVFFGGDAAFGPKNVITAVAHGHQAAISVHLRCEGLDIVADRPAPHTNLHAQKMGIHEWSYDSYVVTDERYTVPQAEKAQTLRDRKKEVELGFDLPTAFREAQRCLNCDVQTVFSEDKCIECDACMDICPTSCISFIADGPEEDIRTRTKVPALNVTQPLYVSGELKTHRIMVKDEDVCLHCGLCAERCPTAAWDMQQYWYNVTKATGCGMMEVV